MKKRKVESLFHCPLTCYLFIAILLTGSDRAQQMSVISVEVLNEDGTPFCKLGNERMFAIQKQAFSKNERKL